MTAVRARVVARWLLRRALRCAYPAAALPAAALPAVALPAVALAGQNPFAFPQGDVDVVYAMPVPAPPGAPAASATALSQRLRVQARSGLQRIDPPGAGAYMLTDGRTGQTTLVEPSLRLATVMPAQDGAGVMPPPGTRATGDYLRLDRVVIAGIPCTDWRTRDQSGHDSVVCLSDDGVMLRIVQDGRVRAQAVRVERTAQPDSVFAVPDGFRTMRAPGAG